jgi:hypothetical protein
VVLDGNHHIIVGIPADIQKAAMPPFGGREAPAAGGGSGLVTIGEWQAVLGPEAGRPGPAA